MKEKVLPGIRETADDYERLRKAISKLLREQVYLPLMRTLHKTRKLENAEAGPLVTAIMSGQVTFHRGIFRGKFSSRISAELRGLGAKWDRRHEAFRLTSDQLPAEVKHAIDLSYSRFSRTASEVNRRLSEVNPEEIAEKLDVSQIFDSTLYKVDKDFKKNVKNITVAPKLTPYRRERIAKEYTQNLQLYVKDFLEKEVVELRQRIQEKVMAGDRYEGMVSEIQRSYGVSQRKATFLARQETSILMAKFHQTQCQEIGVDEYVWQCVAGSPKHPVRPLHLALKGTRQRWSAPPIVNEQGDRKNPGQDYNCRCFARPIVKF